MSSVLEFNDVSVIRDGKTILNKINWTVEGDQRWVVIGPNGAGKTTMLQLAAALMHPSRGSVSVLGETLGRVDVFELRPRIGFASTASARRLPGNERVLDAVMTAAYSVSGRWNEEYEEIDERRARRVLREWLDKKTLGSPAWPFLILEWQGAPDTPPFESYRSELLPPREDAFS